MFDIRNGILYENGKAQIALGTSYYASFHPDKYPVPPEGDRYGEMRTDIRDIAAAGFNHVRTAALGSVRWEDGEVKLDFPFIDQMLREIAESGMASFVRLHGYTMNYRNRPGTLPVNHKGEEGNISGFVHDCAAHPELMRDNELATVAMARHFARFDEMLGYQIYNEPAYSYNDFFDYNPHNIAAYRRWLVDKRIMAEEEARECEPPRRRPRYDESPEDWIRFRLFCTEQMAYLLNHLNEYAHRGNPKSESFTCEMPLPFQAGCFRLGEDFYDIAEGMDIVGMTQYMKFRGEAYYFSQQVLDGLESAAAVCGKHAWIIEFNTRTHLRVTDFDRETFAALGAGIKGLNYYLWRADMAGPEMQLGGMVWNDRSKTPKFDEAVKTLALINRMSEKLATAEKRRDGVAVLFSKRANAYFDAIENFDKPNNGRDRNCMYMAFLYNALKKKGLTADFVRGCDLDANRLGTRLLLIPTMEGLGEDELAQVGAFAADHPVFILHSRDAEQGYRVHPACQPILGGRPLTQDWSYRGKDRSWSYRLTEVLRMAAVSPGIRVVSSDDRLGFGYLENTDDERPYIIACLVNIDSFDDPVSDGALVLDERLTGRVTRAVFHSRDRELPLAVEGDAAGKRIVLPPIDGGCMIVLD